MLYRPTEKILLFFGGNVLFLTLLQSVHQLGRIAVVAASDRDANTNSNVQYGLDCSFPAHYPVSQTKIKNSAKTKGIN